MKQLETQNNAEVKSPEQELIENIFRIFSNFEEKYKTIQNQNK